jgi:glycosyltransferase involved in cell wall biosynthesis
MREGRERRRGPPLEATSEPELSVVMPVYREAEILPAVLDAWSAALGRAGIDYELRAYDDGSPDGSLALLRERAAADPRLIVTSHSNVGHGPTLLRGYREARGLWVLQIDSDGELPPEPFLELWKAREGLDFGLGVRAYERRRAARRLVSLLARLTVLVAFGPGLRDPNAPYRLMRVRWLRDALRRLPERAFAPNVLLAGLAIRDGIRLREVLVPARPRRTGASSLGGAALWRGAWQSLRETLRIAQGRR